MRMPTRYGLSFEKKKTNWLTSHLNLQEGKNRGMIFSKAPSIPFHFFLRQRLSATVVELGSWSNVAENVAGSSGTVRSNAICAKNGGKMTSRKDLSGTQLLMMEGSFAVFREVVSVESNAWVVVNH